MPFLGNLLLSIFLVMETCGPIKATMIIGEISCHFILILSFRDVKMDWSLGDPRNGMLRDRLMFFWKGWYYLAILLDFILRFAWTLTLVGASGGPFSGPLV